MIEHTQEPFDKNYPEGYEVKKRVKLYLVEEGVEIEQLSGEMKLDDNMMPKIVIRENRMEVGAGEYHKEVNGSIQLKLMMVGDTRMESNNVSGMTRLEIFIPASLRKD